MTLIAYTASAALLVLALVVRARRFRRACLAIGALTVLGTCGSRLHAVRGDAPLRVITLPGPGSTRWVNALVPEREGTLLAAELLDFPREDEALLRDLLRTAYARMDREVGAVPTPAIATYLGLQSPSRFDAILVEPRQPVPPRTALVFLHGYAGNFDVYCWYAAYAARATATLVICPSVGPRGDFWQEHGARTVRATLEYLHGRGIHRIVLAGLSNGAIGAGVLAPRFARELDGLILISGAPQRAPPPIPVLAIQGSRDSMIPAARARSYAARAGGRGEYLQLDGGHFVFLSQSDRVTAAIERFLVRRWGHDAD